MGRCFEHFDLEQRCEIARRRQARQSLRQIAAALDCAPSSVSRELKRNAAAGGYVPAYATQQAHARRWRGSKLLRDPSLQTLVLERLCLGWAPQTVAARLAQDHGRHISHETISEHQPKSSPTCCISNVNPPSRLRGNDEQSSELREMRFR